MEKEPCMAHIQEALAQNDANEALRLIALIQEDRRHDAELLCLEGKAYLKKSDWRRAQNAFLKADHISPDGTAKQYLHMLSSIMDFYNKDMYNQ